MAASAALNATTSPARNIRVMVVDDSAFMRKMVSSILNAADGMEVVGTARDGEDALAKVAEYKPDVITLDVEMPRLNGIEFLEALMRTRPTPVVMVSSLTGQGAETTLACLQRGAVDFVLKPSGSISLDIEKVGADIVAKARAAAGARVFISRPAERAPLPTVTGAGRREHATAALSADTRILAIASSTGGPAALMDMVPRLPGDLQAAVVIVQHMPPGFTKSLAARLDGASALTVCEAQEGDLLQRGLVLLAPGGRHMEIGEGGRVRLNDNPPLWGVRPAADVLLGSVAARYGERVISVTLTGMGCDGARGAKAVRAHNGYCFAQSEATCVVYGMPRAAVEMGGIHRTVHLTEMAAAAAQQVSAPMLKIEGAR